MTTAPAAVVGDEGQDERRRHRHRHGEASPPASAGQGGRLRSKPARAPPGRRAWRRGRGRRGPSGSPAVAPAGHADLPFDLYNTAAGGIHARDRRSGAIVPPPGAVRMWHDRHRRRIDGHQRARRIGGRPGPAGRCRPAHRRLPRHPARPGRPGPARRVRHVRPPRVGVQRRVQRGPHRGHDRGDLPLPRGERHGRSAVHRTRHARPVAARVRDRARRPRCARCRHPDRRGRWLHADTRDLACDPRPQPGAQRAARRRDRRHPVAQPARGRRLQVQPAQRRPRRHRRHGLDPGRGQPAARSGPGRGTADRSRRRRCVDHALRLRRDVRGRSRQRHRHGRHPFVGAADRGRPARWGERGVLAGDRRALRPRPDRHQRHGRPAVRVHDLRLGRADPDGPVVAPRDGPPRRVEGPLRRRPRQRHRRRPPRHRHAGRGPPQPEPLPRGRGRPPVRWRARLGSSRSPSARRSSRAR